MIPVQVLQSILVIVDHTMTSEQMEVKIYDNSKTVLSKDSSCHFVSN